MIIEFIYIGFVIFFLVIFKIFEKGIKAFTERCFISIALSFLMTVIIGSIIICFKKPEYVKKGEEFVESEYEKGNRFHAKHHYYSVEDTSLIVIDTITGITFEIKNDKIIDGIIPVSYSMRTPIKYHMTDEVYRSWKDNNKK